MVVGWHRGRAAIVYEGAEARPSQLIASVRQACRKGLPRRNPGDCQCAADSTARVAVNAPSWVCGAPMARVARLKERGRVVRRLLAVESSRGRLVGRGSSRGLVARSEALSNKRMKLTRRRWSGSEAW
jgi:hypothetical protein